MLGIHIMTQAGPLQAGGSQRSFRKGWFMWFTLGLWRSGMIQIGREKKGHSLGRNEMYKDTEAGIYRLHSGNN